MNRERLKIARDYLANEVKPEMFRMHYFRTGDKTIPKCNSVGCAIGHLTALDDKFKTNPDYFRDGDGEIDFEYWGMRYFELSSLEYGFIASPFFSYGFPDYTAEQQLAHAVERIDYLIKYGKVPKGYDGALYAQDFPLGFSKDKRKWLKTK